MKLIIYLDIIDHFSAKAIFNSDETNALRKESWNSQASRSFVSDFRFSRSIRRMENVRRKIP